MDSSINLQRVITTLARIDDAGWLGDLECDVARSRRGPRDDMAHYPHFGFAVEKLARVASRLLDLPIGECRDAARQALLPETRRGLAMEFIEQYERQLNEAEARTQAQRKLATDRRRLRA